MIDIYWGDTSSHHKIISQSKKPVIGLDKNDYYAKPNIGMFKRCEKENPQIKFKNGYFLGDKLTDLKAAINIGAQPILVRTGHGKDTETKLNRHTYKKIKQKTKIYDNLAEFVEKTI